MIDITERAQRFARPPRVASMSCPFKTPDVEWLLARAHPRYSA